MPDREDRFQAAIARFDAANSEDPNVEPVGGVTRPGALVYGQRMTERLNRFASGASEALRLAARAQHLQRWTIPRTRFPEGRKGYHEWRTALARFHADSAAAILRDVGYEEPVVARVQFLLRKEKLKLDAEVQVLEDVACLVFLEHYAQGFAGKHPEDKVVDIVRKTWRKMSPAGQRAALALRLPAPVAGIVERALAS